MPIRIVSRAPRAAFGAPGAKDHSRPENDPAPRE
jgi:hypothetical protein